MNELLSEWVPRLVGALSVLIIGYAVALALVAALKSWLSRTQMDQTILSFAASAARALLFALLLVIALSMLGVNSASLVAVLGAAGLAIALSLQGSLANLASGVLLSIFRPFRVGDAVDVGGDSGVVDEMHILFTRLHTFDNRGLIIPNSKVLSNSIINMAAFETRRLDLTFGIGYQDDIDKAKAVLQEIVEADGRILKDPAPVIGLAELGDSSVNFWVRPWVNRADYLDVMFDLNEAVKKRFDTEGISIPYPQREVHLHTASPAI